MIRPKATSVLWLPPKSLADGLIDFSDIGKEKNHNGHDDVFRNEI